MSKQSVIEELRKLAMELDVKIITAVQPNFNRSYRPQPEPELTGKRFDFIIIDDCGFLPPPKPKPPSIDDVFL